MEPPQAEPVPTLEEALLLTRELGWLVNVELKDHQNLPGHGTIAGIVLALVQAMNMLPQVLFSSFQKDYLREIHQMEPSARLGLLVETTGPESPEELCRQLGTTFFHPSQAIAETENLPRLCQAGLTILPWTVNDPASMDFLLRTGASGLITDDPQAARQAVARLSPC